MSLHHIGAYWDVALPKPPGHLLSHLSVVLEYIRGGCWHWRAGSCKLSHHNSSLWCLSCAQEEHERYGEVECPQTISDLPTCLIHNPILLFSVCEPSSTLRKELWYWTWKMLAEMTQPLAGLSRYYRFKMMCFLSSSPLASKRPSVGSMRLNTGDFIVDEVSSLGCLRGLLMQETHRSQASGHQEKVRMACTWGGGEALEKEMPSQSLYGGAFLGWGVNQAGTMKGTSHPESAYVRPCLGKSLRFQEPKWRPQNEWQWRTSLWGVPLFKILSLGSLGVLIIKQI